MFLNVGASTAKVPAICAIFLTCCAFAHAFCPVDVVLVRGRIEAAPGHAQMRVQLLYPRNRPGEAGDVIVENERFSVPLDFLTESRRPIINGSFGKCNRRPLTVVVTLVDSDKGREYDRVSLDFAKDFKMADPSTYISKSEVVLKGPR